MSEMKIHATDPKVIAAVVITNHGQMASHDDVVTIAWEALRAVDEDPRDPAYDGLVDEVKLRIASAEVIVRWDDDEDGGITYEVSDAAACGGPCCT